MAMAKEELEKTETAAAPVAPKGAAQPKVERQVAGALAALRALAEPDLAYDAFVRDAEGWIDTRQLRSDREEATKLLAELNPDPAQFTGAERRLLGEFFTTRPYMRHYANDAKAAWTKAKAPAKPDAAAAQGAPKAAAVRTAPMEAFKFAQQPGEANTICAAGYGTGWWKGKNAHGLSVAKLHPLLREIMHEFAGEKVEAWDVKACAEIEAVHKALTANADAAQLRISSVNAYGSPKPPCENCQNWLVRVGAMGNEYRIKPGVLREAMEKVPQAGGGK